MAKKSDDSRLFAFIAAFLSIIGFIIALIFRRDDDYVMHYAKQSLVIFIAYLIVILFNSVLKFVPIFGEFVPIILSVLVFILWIFSWVYALLGEKKEIPLIGHYASLIRI